MNIEQNQKYIFFDTPAKWIEQLKIDFLNAKLFIYIEIYRFNNDLVGNQLIEILSQKCKEGVKVLIIIDSWGSNVPRTYFEKIINFGGKVKYFDKIKITFDYFLKNHLRNHRKILIIDDKITHFGSANITHYSQNWRESILRIEGDIATIFYKIFIDNWKNANLEFYKRRKFQKTIYYKNFKIIRDIPSIYFQKIKKHIETQIRKAKKEINIITPYFLPGYKIRRLLILAAKKGVSVNVYIPEHSDVRLVDYIRDKYLGVLYKNKINIFLYQGTNLHAKLLLVDNEVFTLGSSNFDYRSFRYMYEIALSSNEIEIIKLLENFIKGTNENSIPFDYQKWLNRSPIVKILGWILIPFRHFF